MKTQYFFYEIEGSRLQSYADIECVDIQSLYRVAATLDDMCVAEYAEHSCHPTNLKEMAGAVEREIFARLSKKFRSQDA